MVREGLKRKIETRPSNMVTRDFMPKTDFNSDNAPFPAEKWERSVTAAANNWVTYIDKTLDDNEMVTFTGVALHDMTDQSITLIRFKLGEAEVKAVYSLTKAYLQQEPIVEFSTPIKYNPGERIVVEVYTTVANPTIRLEMLGFKVEPRGKVIAGKPSK